jgi:divalent metal cation (Fe/Co/Zn/Cd) transporter
VESEVGNGSVFKVVLPKERLVRRVVAMGITFAFSRYELRQGNAIGSPSLIADAKHIRTDMMSSGVILAGLVGGLFGLELDRIAAMAVHC